MALFTQAISNIPTFVTKTAAYTATSGDDVIAGDTSGAAFSITLPPAGNVTGKHLKFIYTDTGTSNALTIDGNGSETINGTITTVLTSQFETLTIVSDGSNWQVLDRQVNPRFFGWSS